MLLFWKIMLTEFIAEMGDKTQLMLIAMTSRYKVRDILLGTAAAIMVLNGIAVLAGGFISSLIPTWLIRIIAAVAFIYFALSTLTDEEDEEESGQGTTAARIAILSVFTTFFVAELGDKTQLTAITFGANEGLAAGPVVWAACSVGLFAADLVGMMIGYLLKSRAPEGILNMIAFLVFAVFGMFTLRQGLVLLLGEGDPRIAYIVIAAVLLFVLSSLILLIRKLQGRRARVISDGREKMD